MIKNHSDANQNAGSIDGHHWQFFLFKRVVGKPTECFFCFADFRFRSPHFLYSSSSHHVERIKDTRKKYRTKWSKNSQHTKRQHTGCTCPVPHHVLLFREFNLFRVEESPINQSIANSRESFTPKQATRHRRRLLEVCDDIYENPTLA